MNQPAGLPSVTTATASVPRPSPYPGFQNSWYSLGINLQTHAPGFCFPPFPSIPLLSSESAPWESPGPDLTGHLVHLGGPVKPRLPVRAWRGGAHVDGQTLSRQAEARHGQARRGRRLARVQGDQGPLEAAVSQGSSNRAGRGSPGEPSGGRAQRGSLALAGSEAQGPPRSDWSRHQGSPGPGSRRAHSCHQSGQADPVPSGRMTPVTRPAGDPPSSMNSPLSISAPVLSLLIP